MVPKKIQPYFKTTFNSDNGDNYLVEGMLTCCDSNDFEVLVVGKIKYSIFSKIQLFPEDDKIIVKIRCKKCGKIVSVFDSRFDGYEQYKKHSQTQILLKSINCKKCNHDGFGITIKYDYPNKQELEELEITNPDNAFTWIYVKLECNKCKTKYKKFVDYEAT